MKILRSLLALILIVLAIPMWRSIDWVSIILPASYLSSSLIGLWAVIFISSPIKLLRPKTHPLIMMAPFLLFWLGAMISGPLSGMATKDDTHTHCGRATYAGFMYPVASLLSDSFRDDLEARNQMCWVRKMIQRIPDKFDDAHEVNTYLDIHQNRLNHPEFKYRVALPLVLIFLGKTLHTWESEKSAFNKIQSATMLVKGIPYWTEQYSTEISIRNYSWWNWPHSALIQFEYGLIEKNWEKLQIIVQEN